MASKAKHNTEKKIYVKWIMNSFSSLMGFYNYVKNQNYGQIVTLNYAHLTSQSKPFVVLGKIIRLTPRLPDIRRAICKKTAPASTLLIKEVFVSVDSIEFGKVFKVKFLGDIANEIETADIHIGDRVVLINPVITENTDLIQHPDVNSLSAVLFDSTSSSVLFCSKISSSMPNKLLDCFRCSTPVSDKKSECEVSESESIENKGNTINNKLLFNRLDGKINILQEHTKQNSPKRMIQKTNHSPLKLNTKQHNYIVKNSLNFEETSNNSFIKSDNLGKNNKESEFNKHDYVKVKDLNDKHLNKKVNMFVIVLDVTQKENAGRKKCLITRVIDDSCIKFKPFTVYVYYEDKKPKVEQKWILRLRHVKIESYNGVFDGRVFSAGSVVSFPPINSDFEPEKPITLRKAPYDCNEYDMSFVINLRKFLIGKNWNLLVMMGGFFPNLPSVTKQNNLESISDENYFSLKCEIVHFRMFFDFNIIVLTVKDGTALQHYSYHVPKDCKLWSEVLSSREKYVFGLNEVDIIIKNIDPMFDSSNFKSDSVVSINNIQILRNETKNGEALIFAVDASYKTSKIEILPNHMCKTQKKPTFLNIVEEDDDDDESRIDNEESFELEKNYKSKAREVIEGLADLPKDLGCGVLDIDSEVIEDIKKFPFTKQALKRKKLFYQDNPNLDSLGSSSESTCDFYESSKLKKVKNCSVILNKVNDEVLRSNSRHNAINTSLNKSNINRNESEEPSKNVSNELIQNEPSGSKKRVSFKKNNDSLCQNKIVLKKNGSSFETILLKENVKISSDLKSTNLLPVVKISKLYDSTCDTKEKDKKSNEEESKSFDFDTHRLVTLSGEQIQDNLHLKEHSKRLYDEINIIKLSPQNNPNENPLIKRKSRLTMKDSFNSSDSDDSNDFIQNYCQNNYKKIKNPSENVVTFSTNNNQNKTVSFNNEKVEKTIQKASCMNKIYDNLVSSSNTSIYSNDDNFVSNCNSKVMFCHKGQHKKQIHEDYDSIDHNNLSESEENFVSNEKIDLEIQSKKITSLLEDSMDCDEALIMDGNIISKSHESSDKSIVNNSLINTVKNLNLPSEKINCQTNDNITISNATFTKRKRGRPRLKKNIKLYKNEISDEKRKTSPVVSPSEMYLSSNECHSPVHISDNKSELSNTDLLIDEDSDSMKSGFSDKIDINSYVKHSKVLANELSEKLIKDNYNSDYYGEKDRLVYSPIEFQRKSLSLTELSPKNETFKNSLPTINTIKSSWKNRILSHHNTVEKINISDNSANNSPPSPTESIKTVQFPFRNYRKLCRHQPYCFNVKNRNNYSSSDNKSISRIEDWLQTVQTDNPVSLSESNVDCIDSDKEMDKVDEVYEQEEQVAAVEEKLQQGKEEVRNNEADEEENIYLENKNKHKVQTDSQMESQSQSISEFVKAESKSKCVPKTQMSAVIVKSEMSFTAVIWDLRPSVTDNSLDIISGFCKESCENFFIHSALKFNEDLKPICPGCYKKGKEVLVKLEFLFELLLILQTGHSITALVYGDHANKFVGCTSKDYLDNEDIRVQVKQRLQYFLGNGHNSSIRYTPPFPVHLIPISLTAPDQTTFIRFCLINTDLPPINYQSPHSMFNIK
ncbi:uncharacterized protein LOC142319343 isoform X1 [Lycorma delicatula]|uniref:uncharacterized protein LOC142319343 isoform X1 n=1 Tax=Lycorma delicatula TaxID=130591 RepID=UPI003F50F3CC